MAIMMDGMNDHQSSGRHANGAADDWATRIPISKSNTDPYPN